MSSVEERDWKAFVIGDMFSIKKPKARSEKNYKDGKVPFIASGNVRNGVVRCVEPKEGEVLDKGGCITVSPVDGSAFYQKFDFLGRGGAGSSIILLYNENLSEYSGLFVARMISRTCSKYCYGKMGSKESLKRERIMLPVGSDGEPDYAFMEEFIKQRIECYKDKAVVFLESELQSLGEPSDVEALEDKEWKEFTIEEEFECAKGIYLKTGTATEGDIPFVTAKEGNNGISTFIGNRTLFEGNKITIEKIHLSAYWQPVPFYCSHDVSVIWNENLNEYNSLFISTMVKRNGQKYSYGRQAQLDVVRREKVLLPINDEGVADYDYMTRYEKNLLIRKYKEGLDFFKD